MTIKELRVLIDSLDEYIRIPGGIERLRKTILHLAVSGQLVPQDPSEGTGTDLYGQVQTEKNKLIRDGKIKKQKELDALTNEDALFKVPNSWYVVNLGDIVTFKRGPFGGSLRKDMFVESGYLVYEQNHAINADFSFGRYFIDEAKYNEMIAFKVLHGDILVSCSGTMGKVAIVPDFAVPGIINQALLLLRSMGHINKEYLKLFLQESTVQSKYFSNQKGTAIQNVAPVPVLKTIPFTLPPLLEQDRIVTKYRQVSLLIDQLENKYALEEKIRNQLTIASLAKLAEGNKLAFDYFTEIIKTNNDVTQLDNALLSLAVRGRLVAQDISEGTGEELYDQIQTKKAKLIIDGSFKKRNDSPVVKEADAPFRIPHSWKWVRLSDITNFTIGRTPKRVESQYWDEAFFPWVSIADLNDQSSVHQTKEKISKRAFEEVFKGSFAPKGSLLYSFKLTIGKMSILGVDAVHNEAIASLETHNIITRDYLFKALKILDPTKRTNAAIKGKTLNSSSLALLEIPLPPLAEQKRIVDKVEEIIVFTKQLRSLMAN